MTATLPQSRAVCGAVRLAFVMLEADWWSFTQMNVSTGTVGTAECPHKPHILCDVAQYPNTVIKQSTWWGEHEWRGELLHVLLCTLNLLLLGGGNEDYVMWRLYALVTCPAGLGRSGRFRPSSYPSCFYFTFGIMVFLHYTSDDLDISVKVIWGKITQELF